MNKKQDERPKPGWTDPTRPLHLVPVDEWGEWLVGSLKELEARANEEGHEKQFRRALDQVQRYLETQMLSDLLDDGVQNKAGYGE